MTLTIIRLSVLCFLLQIPISQAAFCQTDDSIKRGDRKSITGETPVVRWTANRDEMNFRYDFLENTETITLYKATPETGTFSHHSYITYFEGVFYAYWDNHVRDENASGQWASLRRSTDQGKTWTPVEELFPSSDKKMLASEAFVGTRFNNANGFAIIDGILYAMSDVSDRVEMPMSTAQDRIGVVRLCRSINPDGTLGEIFCLGNDPLEPVEGFPAYPAGDPELVEKINNYIAQPGNEIQLDFTNLTGLLSDDDHIMIEPNPSYRLSDGTWVRLYRDMGSKHVQNRKEEEATKSRRLYASFSFDNGKTWTVATRISFPDASARSNAGRLPDGQVYVINNVLPLSPKNGGRSLLAISLSRDGLNFDRVAVIRFVPPPRRYEGRAKSRGFQYPHSVVVGDNLWVMYSVNKEDI
ncbi:MAG: exo-alpha-sialidase, partial [Bacteroidales bacterium]|nr:exo-alpha-sialidase [Bacteroidales bacterium]